MGSELNTRAALNDAEADCRALLESTEIVLRGGVKGRFPFATIDQLSARAGWLSFTCGAHRVRIRLGDLAPRWIDAIRNPRTRVQKLGIEPGQRVVALGPTEPDAIEEITAALGAQPRTRLAPDADVVLLFTRTTVDLDRLAAIEPQLAPRGAVWVLWPKGRPDFRHEDVVDAARAVGLTQTRSMGFSVSRTGLRLVRPASPKRAAR